MANSFYPFAINSDSNLMPLSTWAESSERASGNVAGTAANSALNNRAIRQGTMLASAIGYYIDSRGFDALDDGSPSNLGEALASAISVDIAAAGNVIIQTAITNNIVAPGDIEHNKLTGRSVNNCHPISAITNLQQSLDNLQSQLDAGTVPDASTTQKGVIRLATQNEVNTGSSYTTAVTPYTLKNTVFSINQIPNLSADKIVSGVFDAARIPSLDASKITSGTLAAARIPDLDASKVTSGVFDAARIPDIDASNIPNLPASKVTSGTFDVDRIPNISADKITSGVLSTSRIPNLDASKITSGTLNINVLPAISVEFANIGGLVSDNAALTAALNLKESTNNKVTAISSSSTNTQYPSAKAVYDYGLAITPSGATWGNIGGNISNQTDLMSQLNNKVTANSLITAGTKCKISYDTKGLVTGGADLQVSDIPNIPATKITGTIPAGQLPTPDVSTLVSGSSATNSLLKVPTTEGYYYGLGFDSSAYTFSSATWQGTIPTAANSSGYMLISLPSGVSSYNSASGVGTVRINNGSTNSILYVTSITRQSNSQLRVNLFCPVAYTVASSMTVYADLSYTLRALVTA